MVIHKSERQRILATTALLLFLLAGHGFLSSAHAKVICPVKGVVLDEKKAPEKVTYKGKTYYLCSKAAKDAFVKNPGKYLKKNSQTPEKKKEDLLANLPDFNVDGYAFQDEVLKRIPKVIAGFMCYCGCEKTLNQCYKDHKCPPT